MHIMPAHQLLIFIFISLFLSPVLSTGLVAKHGCQDACGNLKIPYPFGIGSDCSLDPSFNVSCDTSIDPPKAYLSILSKEVIEINKTYIRVKYPNLVSACYGLSGESYKNTSTSLNLTGTPYTVSNNNRLIAIGCDDMVMQSNGSWVRGGCSAFCAHKDDSGGVGYCANSSSFGNGCCQAEIYRGDGTINFVGAELSDTSGNFQRRKLFPCSYAFIQEWIYGDKTVFSYPLYYLDNSTNYFWAATTTAPVVRLDWMIIGAENCSRAQNSSTYACKDSKSVCDDATNVDGDDFYFDEYNEYESRGYHCRCVRGYEGNPYLLGGCQAISFSNLIAQSGCLDQCGKLSIPFPFGVGRNCYRDPSFEIICNSSTKPPVAYLNILKVEIIQIKNSSQVLVKNPYQMGLACYNLSNYQRGTTKTEERSLIIDLSETQYTLSEENIITAIGCDDMVVGIVRQDNKRFIGSSCSSVCWEGQTDPSYDIHWASNSDYYSGPRGCCNAAIPRGTAYLEAILSDLSGQRNRSKFFSCSYVAVGYMEYFGSIGLSVDLNNSTAAHSEIFWYFMKKLMLDWRIGEANSDDAKKNMSSYACKENSECVEFVSKVGGYLCNCSKGYQGNPYIANGCQDIDECADNTTNPCNSNSICINTPGSVHCLCTGNDYQGDGRRDGMGCIHERQPKTKMVIFIGIGSGLGFLLFLVMVFWLYKVFQKRKEKLLKEKFFKRNGGLLLRQQTNEGVLGKTKVFPANELVVAIDNFNESRILGQGGQGTVYKGMLSDGKIVAVKKSKLVEENQLEQFINEVAILSQINHRNVVKLLGCCLETEVPLLVYEFMSNGTLFDLIHDLNNEFPFPWNMRMKIGADIAGALAYLHSASSMPIYHRDIKSSNILLDEKYIVKVSDFGTSRSIATDQTHLTTMVKGTFGYLDPEYFQSSQFTEKSDVYSFGVVLVELLTGQRPISFDKTEEERGLATRFLTSMEEDDLDTMLDPQVSEHCRKEEVVVVARLAQRCLNLKGKLRPSMKEVATELESFRISQLPTGAKDEFEEVRDFEDLPTTISDIEYTWTGSSKGATTSSSDTHPLIFTDHE